MLSAVPLPRLLEGIAASLRTHVAPHVDDRFALMQLRAVDELLRNLAGRVEWNGTEIATEVEETEELLGVLRAAGWDGEPAAAADGQAESPAAALLDRRSATLVSLREAMAWVVDQKPEDARGAEARAATVAFLRAGNARERERLKSGMYG